MDFRSWYPNENLVHIYSSVAKCATVWDGHRLPGGSSRGQNRKNTTELEKDVVAGMTYYEVTVFPIAGYFDFYAINQTHAMTGAQGGLWCGPTANLFITMANQKGDEFETRFRMLSLSIKGVMDIFFSPHFASLIDIFPNPLFRYVPFIFQRSTVPIVGIELGSFAMQRRYVRRELAFLMSFTDVTWSAIAVTLLVVALSTSCIYEVSRLFKREGQGSQQSWAEKTFHRFIKAVFLLSSLLLAESSGDADWMNSLLLALWLLAATVLSGCMNGSMRDLMSAAAQELVPETWDDAWIEPFSSMTLWVASFVPSWPRFRDLYPKQIEERLAAGKMYICMASPEDWFDEKPIEREFRWYIHHMITSFDSVLFLAVRTAVYTIFWSSVMYQKPLIEYIATQDDLLETLADGNQAIELGREERLTAAHDVYMEVFDRSYDYYYSPPRYEGLLYLPISSSASRDLKRFFDNYAQNLTENGHMILCMSATDRIEERFHKMRGDNMAFYEDLLMIDFKGPLMCYAVVIGTSMMAFLGEMWWFHKRKMKISIKRTKLLNMSRGGRFWKVKVHPAGDVPLRKLSEGRSQLFIRRQKLPKPSHQTVIWKCTSHTQQTSSDSLIGRTCHGQVHTHLLCPSH